MAAKITEHQGHARTCPCCRAVTRATIPTEIRAHSVGPNLTAWMGCLTGVYGVSKRSVEEIVEQTFEVSID